jgi:hypothetical protein
MSSTVENIFDAIVIGLQALIVLPLTALEGGGIEGSSTAYFLAKKNLKVLLLEQVDHL